MIYPTAWTLGERLDELGRRLAARHLPTFPWATGLTSVFARVAALTPFEGRFDRVESPPAGADPVAYAGRPSWPQGFADAGPAPVLRSAPVPGRVSAGSAPGTRPPSRVGRLSAPAGAARPDLGPATERDDARSAGGRSLPADVRGRLRGVAGPAADALRVHDDGPADAVARAQRADAVTVGRDVFFRQGRYRPREPRGFGLLAHEAAHVQTLLQPGAAWRRRSDEETRAEERVAIGRERAARDRAAPAATLDGPATDGTSLPSPAGSAPPPTSPDPAHGPEATRPMRAAVDRAGSPPPSALDVEALRRGLVDDLMRQLRAEFERGG